MPSQYVQERWLARQASAIPHCCYRRYQQLCLYPGIPSDALHCRLHLCCSLWCSTRISTNPGRFAHCCSSAKAAGQPCSSLWVTCNFVPAIQACRAPFGACSALLLLHLGYPSTRGWCPAWFSTVTEADRSDSTLCSWCRQPSAGVAVTISTGANRCPSHVSAGMHQLSALRC